MAIAYTPASEPESSRVAGAVGAVLRRAVFVDKNGTLNDERADNESPESFSFAPFALEGIKALSDMGFAIVVLTCEPGLGLGLVNRATLSNVEHMISSRLRNEAGVELAGFYTCPHKPGPRGEPACLCRVPAPGLLRQASRSLRLDPEGSWMVGDTLNDVEAGRRIGCRTVLVDSGSETAWRMSPLRTPHHRAGSLLEASQIIAQSPYQTSSLALEIEVPGAGADPGSLRARAYASPSASQGAAALPARSPALRIGPLQGFEPHPTREWL